MESRTPGGQFCTQADIGALVLTRKDNEALGQLRGVSADGMLRLRVCADHTVARK